MKKQKAIKSSLAATQEMTQLKSVWSSESYLSLRVLVYCSELLESIAKKPKRKPSPWQLFMASELKKGQTLQQAASTWKNARKLPS